MNQADRVRQYVSDEVIEPARRQGKTTVQVKAGDVHKALGFNNSMPLVCGALDARKFLDFAKIRIVARSGPRQSSSVVWVLSLYPQSLEAGELNTNNLHDHYTMIDTQYELSLQMADDYAHRVAEGKYNDATKLVCDGLAMLIAQNCQIIELLRHSLEPIDKQPE